MAEETRLDLYDSDDYSALNTQILSLKEELNRLETQITAFEQTLKSHILNFIVEEQELTILYKKQKQEKKTKRLEQKHRGKNYKPPTSLKVLNKKEESPLDFTQQKEKKKLYREAMFHVHPDKFSTSDTTSESATDITVKLIDIYQNGTLEELQEFYAYILNKEVKVKDSKGVSAKIIDRKTYLEKEKESLELAIKQQLNKYSYKVLTTYNNPLDFVEELKNYYTDRIFKLKKRTRTK